MDLGLGKWGGMDWVPKLRPMKGSSRESSTGRGGGRAGEGCLREAPPTHDQREVPGVWADMARSGEATDGAEPIRGARDDEMNGQSESRANQRSARDGQVGMTSEW